MASASKKVGLSYLLALYVVSFSRFAWLPWIVLYLHQRKYNSWSSTVSAYGLLLSCYQVGQYGGHVVTRWKVLNSSWYTVSFMTLTGSFIALCFITRITIVLILFALMGFSGTILAGVSINIDSNTPQVAFLKKASELDIIDNLERNLVCFAFVILIAGYLYDPQPLSQFPMYSLAVLLALFCLLVLVYYLLVSRMITAKSRNTSIGGIAGGSVGSGTPTASPTDSTADVSSTAVAEYTGAVPSNFLSNCGGNLSKARAMYGKTLHWRKTRRVNDILSIPQPYFSDILKYYPHAIHGYSLDGCAVVYETLGKGDMAGLKRIGASIDQIVWHFALRNELVFQRLLDPEFVRSAGGVVAQHTVSDNPDVLPVPVHRLMTVLDVGGISFSSVNGDVLSFIKKSGELIDDYYPEQVARLVICNAPSWFSTLWRLISGALPESVQKKIDILYDSKGLDKFIHPSQRPVAYGGTDVELGKAAGHLAFLALETAWAEQQKQDNASAAQPPSAGVAASSSGATGSSSIAPVATGKESSSAGANSKSTSASSGKSGGVLGWFRRPQAAYLGEELSLRYNNITGTWDDVASTDDADREPINIESAKWPKDAADKKSGTKATAPPPSTARRLQEQVAEHGMVLAIHAAHRASARNNSANSSLPGSSLGAAHNALSGSVEDGLGSRSFSFQDGEQHLGEDEKYRKFTRSGSNLGFSGGEDSGANSSEADLNAKLSPTLFLLVLTGYLFCLFVQTALFTLIPVWMVIPASAGGMEYSVREVSLVLSSAAIFALVGHKLLSRRSEHILKSSPVRALRIGCGLLLIVLMLLPSFMEYTTRTAEVAAEGGASPSLGPYDPTANSNADDVVFRYVKVFGKTLPSHVPVSYSTFAAADHHNVAYDYVNWASSKYTFHHRSILALQMPALLLALMLCGLQLCRRATGVLLHLTLSSSFHAPASIRRALNGCVDIGGPTLAALLFSLLYGMRLKFPLDASGFYSISGCTILLVYIGTLLLKVQFRGDYGVMPDFKETHYGEQSVSLDGGLEIAVGQDDMSGSKGGAAYQRGGRRGLGLGGGEGGMSGGMEDGAAGPGRLSALERIFNVPLGDASLLYAPIFAAYGSKLYNLKDDFKDV